MAAADVLTWNPTGQTDQRLKDAFVRLEESTDKVVVTEQDKPNRFILKSKGYFDLQAYVLTGKDFPNTNEEFEAQMPEKAFGKLTNIDPDIYGKTKKTMVAIGKTCNDYHRDHLSKLVTAGSTAIEYSNTALDWLTELDDINLKHNLNIVLDPKYRTGSDQDSAYQEAKEAAQATLGVLRDEALTKKQEVNKIKETMMTFRDNTMNIFKDVQFLTVQYDKGPAQNPMNMQKPYLTYLNEQLKKDTDAFWDTLNKYNGKFDEWKEATGAAIVTAFCGPIGWIVTGIKAAEAVQLRKAYEALLEQIEKLKQDRQEETDLINFVGQLVRSFHNIDGKMNTAIEAMSELSELFTEQASCYDGVASALNGMNAGLNVNSLITRQKFVNTCLDKAIKKLHELREVAQEFTRSIINQKSL